MTKRYFKSTDGRITIFRASASRAYTYGRFTRAFGFCNQPSPDTRPAVEITKAEFNAILALKTERVRAQWAARCERLGVTEEMDGRWYGNSPTDSFIYNTQLEG